MNRLKAIGIVFTLFLINIVINLSNADPLTQTPVLVVSGTVTDAQGKALGAGIQMEIVNDVSGLKATGVTNANGIYIVTLVDIDPAGGLIAASVGDTITVKATQGEKSGSKSYKLTANDINTAQITVNVTVDSITPPSLHFTKIGDKSADTVNALILEVNEGTELRLVLLAEGGKGNLTYSANMPTGAKIEGNAFIWTPDKNTVTSTEKQKDFAITLSVSDGTTKADQKIIVRVKDLPDIPTLSILEPTSGQVLPTGTTSTKLSVKITNHTGFWCWKLNDPFPASGSAGGNRVESGDSATITGLQNVQSYTVYVTLVDTKGNLLSPAITASVSFSVAKAVPSLAISTPINGQVFPAGTTSTPLTVNITNHTGAWVWKLNEPFPTTGTAGDNKVSTGNTITITGLKDEQTYTVYVALVDSNGNLLNPSVTASVKFSVSSQPYFIISALKDTVTVASGFATYLIKLEGKNGYTGGVTLYDSELPKNITASFSKKKVILSPSEPLATVQLDLSVPADTIPGEHPFTIIAIPDKGETKKLPLTLKIESNLLIETAITIVLQSSEVPFMDKLALFGQVAIFSDNKSVSLVDLAVKIIFTSPGGKAQTFESKTDSEGNYKLATIFTPDEIGKWNIKAQFDGNTKLKGCSGEKSFSVIKGHSEITFSTGNTGALGTETMILCSLEPQLKGELISLKIVNPDGKSKVIPGINTESSGIFRYTLPLDTAGDWEVTVTWAGNKNYEAVTRTLRISVSNEFGKMILVLGGSYQANDPDWQTSSKMMDYIHNILVKQRSFDEDDIYFLSPDPKAQGIDSVTSLTTLEFAITQWANKLVNPKVPLFIYMLSHNIEDQFLLERHADQETYLTPVLLDSWLDKLPEGTQTTIIIEACHSGNFIRTNVGEPSALVGMNRTIIASASGDKRAMIMNNLNSFSRLFFDRISANETIKDAFYETIDTMSRLKGLKGQYPEMDADGDGKVNQPQDYAALSKTYLPANFISKASPPDIIDLTPSQTLPKGVASLRIYAKVLGASIIGVTATVIPPNIDFDQDITWSSFKLPEFDLAKASGKDNEYAATYGDFTIPGEYAVIINAENPDGSAIPVQTTITVPGGVIKGDVSGDGKVQSNDAILVLRIVAGIITPTDTQKQSADVNGDGKVGVNDAILILRMAAGLAAPVRNEAVGKDRSVCVSYSYREGVMDISLDNTTGVYGGYITIAYDSFHQMEVTSETGVLFESNIDRAGLVKIVFASAEGLSRNIIRIRFESKVKDNEPLLKEAELYDRDGCLLHTQIKDIPPKLDRSMLMQNYPNPFNPETWIPYQLAKPADVTIRIYNANGQLVRTLALGQKPSGVYIERVNSAYWDGMTDYGESVSSGVYFYNIQAGEYRANRKMIVVR